VATPSKQTSTLRKDEFATPKAPNKRVAGTRNIVQADIKVSFMDPQGIYESRATYAVCSNLYSQGPSLDDVTAGFVYCRSSDRINITLVAMLLSFAIIGNKSDAEFLKTPPSPDFPWKEYRPPPIGFGVR
jgi:hypothetical protein